MYDVTGKRRVDEVLAVPCGSRRTAHAVVEQAEAEGWRNVRVVEEDTEFAWRCGVRAAVRELFPADVAKQIEQAEAFGALVYQVRERARAYDHTPDEVLGAIEIKDRALTSCVDDPAEFLAAKVRDLPNPAEGSEQAGEEVSQAAGLRSADAVHEIDFRELGRQAFVAGQPSAPALNAEVRAAIDGMPVGTGAANIMRKFSAGWHEANASSGLL